MAVRLNNDLLYRSATQRCLIAAQTLGTKTKTFVLICVIRGKKSVYICTICGKHIFLFFAHGNQ
jgi:hypothetical protein